MNTGKIIIVGATGVFGSRLVEQLRVCCAKNFVLAGRNLKTLEAIAGADATVLVMDRLRPDAAALQACRGSTLVDAAGPFQNSGYALVEACIAAGVNYIDLADARHFVGGIARFDAAAKAAGVAVISGASSTPALSHAVLDDLTKGWQRIDRIFVGITPGNRAPRGESVVRAILSFAGAPMRVFDDGAWRDVTGWSGQEPRDLLRFGRRTFAHCETPDQDLLVERYKPTSSAVFKAGLELGVMHYGLAVLAWLRTRGVLGDLTKLTPVLLWMANLLKPFGTDKGGMVVEASGVDANGQRVQAKWCLWAEQGIGPNVPTFAALVLLLRDGVLEPGARASAGVLALEEFAPHFQRLGIVTETVVDRAYEQQVFRTAIGDAAWAALPAANHGIHLSAPDILLRGEAKVEGAATALGRVVARIFGFPPAASKIPVAVSITSDGVAEHWRRRFGEHVMATVMTSPDPAKRTVEERFGPFRFSLRLDADDTGLAMVPVGLSILGLPLPRFMLPDISARESVDAEGRHRFDVRIAKWPFGLLVHYWGWLTPV